MAACCVALPAGSALPGKGFGGHEHVEHAHQQWDAAGRPGWARLGLAATPTAQTIYVDEPGNRLAVLAGASTR